MTPEGVAKGNSHDVGERISWTLRPVVSTKLNQVTFEDGSKEDYPETKPLPKVGDEVAVTEQSVENEKMVTKSIKRKAVKITTWEQRRDSMKGSCFNCHNRTLVDNFYQQFDDLVVLYNDKFAKPAQQLMDDLTKDGVLNAKAPFEHEVQWVFWELWHHEGRRARHGASMMGPDYTHWHGMYEVAKHFYTKFLPAVVDAAAVKSPELKKKYQEKVNQLLARDENRWIPGPLCGRSGGAEKGLQRALRSIAAGSHLASRPLPSHPEEEKENEAGRGHAGAPHPGPSPSNGEGKASNWDSPGSARAARLDETHFGFQAEAGKQFLFELAFRVLDGIDGIGEESLRNFDSDPQAPV